MAKQRYVGAVKGKAPSTPNGNIASIQKAIDASRAGGHAFDQAKGRTYINKHGSSKDRERRCLEEIQNGQEKDSILERRYPPRMIKRIRALLAVTEDSENKDFIHAWRLVREILGKRQGHPEEDKEKAQPDRVEVTFGRMDVPMPGTPGATPPPEE